MLTCVNERVAGRRQFNVSSSTQMSAGAPTYDTTTLWDEANWGTGRVSYVEAESYGLSFATIDEHREHMLTHGYLRPFFVDPATRARRMMRYMGLSHKQVEYIMSLYPTPRDRARLSALLKRDDISRAIRRENGYQHMKEIWHDHPIFGGRYTR